MKHLALSTKHHHIDADQRRGYAVLGCEEHPEWWCEATVMNIGRQGVAAGVHCPMPAGYDSPELTEPDELQLRLSGASSPETALSGLFRLRITRDQMVERAMAWTQFCRETFGGTDCWVRQVMNDRGADSLVLLQHVDEPALPDCIARALPWVITEPDPAWICRTLRV